MEIVKVSIVGFTGYKILKSFGKKDYGDLVLGVATLYVGLNIYLKVGTWYTNFMDSVFMRLIIKIFG